MSSRGHQRLGRGGSSVVGAHPAEDLIAEPPAEGSDRLSSRVIGREPMLEVRPARPAQSDLGDGDALEDHVELTVAGPAEAMALGVAGPDRQRCRSVVPGVLCGRREATDAGRLAHQLGGGQVAAALQVEERRGEPGDEPTDLALEVVDRRGQLADPGD
jgi:hypothetical protein